MSFITQAELLKDLEKQVDKLERKFSGQKYDQTPAEIGKGEDMITAMRIGLLALSGATISRGDLETARYRLIDLINTPSKAATGKTLSKLISGLVDSTN